MTSWVQADEPEQITRLDQLSWSRSQEHYYLPDAVVAWVDFPLMRFRFPKLRDLSDGDIEAWIKQEYARVSKLQLRLRGIRTTDFRVDLTNSKIYAHPGDYYRAGVAEGLLNHEVAAVIDIKFSGTSREDGPNGVQVQEQLFAQAKTPEDLAKLRSREYSNGVGTMGEANAEVSREQAIQAGFDAGMEIGETVENYFIIYPGYDILTPDGTVPAALLGRQAHRRGSSNDGSALYRDRQGGFQASKTQAAVDFGGAEVIIPEVADRYSAKNPAVPFDAQNSKPWAWGHEVALAFKQQLGKNVFEARGILYRHFAEMLGTLGERWAQTRPALVQERFERDLAVWASLPDAQAFQALPPLMRRYPAASHFERFRSLAKQRNWLSNPGFVGLLGDLLSRGSERALWVRLSKWASLDLTEGERKQFFEKYLVPKIIDRSLNSQAFGYWVGCLNPALLNAHGLPLVLGLMNEYKTALSSAQYPIAHLLVDSGWVKHPDVIRQIVADFPVEKNRYYFLMRRGRLANPAIVALLKQEVEAGGQLDYVARELLALILPTLCNEDLHGQTVAPNQPNPLSPGSISSV